MYGDCVDQSGNRRKAEGIQAHTDVEIEKALRQATAVFEKYRGEPFTKRAQLMMSAATLLEQEKDELASNDYPGDGKIISR